VTLSADQRTRIRESVLGGSNVPRVDNVNFAVRVGTVVPASVRFVAVPEVLIAIHPEWRDDEYFVVRDEIIIVDRERRIAAMVPLDSSSAESSGASTSSSASTMSHDGGGSLSLSQEEIRQLQIALNAKGFNIGTPDGVLGPRTTQALIQFQRREGFQATGQIDSRTVTALGISSKGGQPMGGQSGMQQQPSGMQGAAQPGGQGQQPSAMPGAGQPGQSTAGQGAGQPSGQGQQSTTGQGGAAQPSANPGAAGAAQPSANPGAANRPAAGAPQNSSGAPMTGGQTK